MSFEHLVCLCDLNYVLLAVPGHLLDVEHLWLQILGVYHRGVKSLHTLLHNFLFL